MRFYGYDANGLYFILFYFFKKKLLFLVKTMIEYALKCGDEIYRETRRLLFWYTIVHPQRGTIDVPNLKIQKRDLTFSRLKHYVTQNMKH